MDDTQIIALFLARDEQAIHETDLAYGRRLHTLANRILLSREDAEESVSDTYLETWKVIPPYRPKYFFAFLASICRHISLNRLDWNLAAKRKADVVSLTEFPHFPNLVWNQNLSPSALVDLIRASPEIGF